MLRPKTLVLCALVAMLGIGWVAYSSTGQEPTQKTDTNKSTDFALAHETLKGWRDYFEYNDASWLHKNRRAATNYDAAWSIIDLDEAVKLHESGRIRTSKLAIMGRLAAAGRIDEVVRFSESFKKGHYQLSQFWARLAELGYEKRDMQIIEAAGRGLEENATYYDTFVGGPPRPNKDLLKARFFVAAARLELMREQPNQFNGTLRNRAASDLLRTARTVQPESMMGITQTVVPTQLERYAILESWTGSLKPSPQMKPWVVNWPFGSTQEKDDRLDPIYDLMAGLNIYWLYPVPYLNDPTVTAWVQRQVLMDRHLVAIAYVLRADGSDIERARLLALISNGLTEKRSQFAKACRDTADLLVGTAMDVDRWRAIEASAEVAVAYQSNGDTKKAKEILNHSIGDFKKLVKESAIRQARDAAASKKKTKPDKLPPADYPAIYALTHALAKADYDRADLPHELLQYIDRSIGSYRIPIEETQIMVRGITRVTDMSKIGVAKTRKTFAHESEYHDSLSNGNYRRAVEVITEKAKGNPAWKSSYPKVGEQSFEEQGLVETLKWTAEITDAEVRMDVEMGALIKAIGHQDKTIPYYRKADRIESITPGIPWPSSGC